MPRMQFSRIVSIVDEIPKLKSSHDDLIKEAIQWGLDVIASSWNWRYLSEETFLTTVAPHTTGNVDVTNGSATVSGGATSPVFTAAMVGRKIRIGGEQAYYRIKTFSSATSIVLEVPYQGDTDTDASYSIFKDEYRLPANLDKLKLMRQIQNGTAIADLDPTLFDVLEPTPTSQGDPNFRIISGSKLDTYSTGTVSATVNTSVITGSSTVWSTLDGFGKQSRITVGSSVFTVKSVDSDTQVTVYENIAATISGSTAYSISLDNLIIQFFDIPDKVQNIYFRYQRIPEILRQDQDIPDLPEQWHHLLVNAGLAVAWKVKDKAEAKSERGEFLAGIELMKKSIGSVGKQPQYRRASMDDYIAINLPVGPRTTGNRGRPFGL